MSLRLGASLAGLVAAGVAAQGPAAGDAAPAERRVAAGVVTGPDDRPLPFARVEFAGAPSPAWFWPDRVDLVTATADHRGLFRVRLLAGLPYSAWAVGPAGADGARAVSRVLEEACVGRFLELRARTVLPARNLVVRGLSAWGEPLSVFVTPAALVPRAFPIAVDAGGRARLPPLPAAPLEIRVEDDGGVLWSALLPEPAPAKHGKADLEASLPPPREIPVIVLEDGKPAPGASIHQMVGRGPLVPLMRVLAGRVELDGWRRAGVAGKDGRAVIRVPLEEDPFEKPPRDLWFLARGRGVGISGFYERAIYASGAKKDGRERLLPFHLAAPSELGCRVEVPVRAGARVVLLAQERLPVPPNSAVFLWRTFSAGVGPGGECSFEFLPKGLQPLAAVLIEQPVGSEPLLWTPLPAGTLSLDPSNSETVTVEVSRPDGAPATGCSVHFLPAAKNVLSPNCPAVQVQLDGSGSARLRLAPGRWLMIAIDGEGCARAMVETGAGRHGRPRTLRFGMQPLARIEGRVLTADGEPAVGASLRLVGTRVTGCAAAEEERLLLRLQYSINAKAFEETETDSRGRFVCRFLDLEGASHEIAASFGGILSGHQSVDDGDHDLEFVIR
ncbi:MAG: hypothetical protein Fur0037_16280 [Planctomycetota bacterium]